MEIETLNRTIIRKSGEEQSVSPVLMLTLYLDASIEVAAPLAAGTLEKYLTYIPENMLHSCQLSSGDAGKLTKRKISRDLKLLRTASPNTEVLSVLYSSSELGPPGDYGVDILLYDLRDDAFEDYSNVIRYMLPVRSASAPTTADNLISFAMELADMVPFASGTLGYGCSYWEDDRFAFEQVLQILPKYLGIEHSSRIPRKWMRGATPTPSWITFLGENLFDSLGGAEKLRAAAPDAIVSDLSSGVAIRAASLPPIGNTNTRAEDIGSLPGVARFLKSKRAKLPFLRANRTELDVQSWLSRFDELENRAWENEGLL